MITLNKIRELILKQDIELENMLKQYFEQSIRKNIESIEKYKENFKKEIENLLKYNKINEANILIDKYKTEFKDDISIYSIESTSLIHQKNFEGAYELLKEGLNIDNKNVDLLYNMAYVNLLMGDTKSAGLYCSKCLENNKSEELKSKIFNILNQIENSKNKTKEYTFITLGVNKDDEIFLKLKKESKTIISIKQMNIDLECDKKYIENEIVFYEVKDYKDIIYDLVENDNCIVIVSDFNSEKYIRKIKDKCKVIYYTNKNLYTDKTDYINNKARLSFENQICNISDIIITNDIKVYNCKRIIENRNNIFLLDFKRDNLFDIRYLIQNKGNILNNEVIQNISDYISNLNIESEYEKLMYSISKNIFDIDKLIDILEYMYIKYNTEEVYKMYVSLLCENKEYKKVINIILNSEFCEKIFKYEILYLQKLKNYNLIDFILKLSINSFFKLETTSMDYIGYKKACYAFEIRKFNYAYNEYISLTNNSKDFNDSPMVNRNTAYLMYSKGNENYVKYYSKYKTLITDFKLTI